MKKFEEAELNILMVENSVICTSGGCAPRSECEHFNQEYDRIDK